MPSPRGGKAKAARQSKARQREMKAQGLSNTRLIKQTYRDKGTKSRMPPPVPKNKDLAEIEAMDPQDPVFRHPQGRPRTVSETPDEDLTWRQLIRKRRQTQINQGRAQVRKWEAEIVVGLREARLNNLTRNERGLELYDEDRLVADGVLELESWDTEELIRGYRKNRQGRFGKPPRYIPREIQQAAIRILVGRSNAKMQEAVVKSTEELVRLAQRARSEKVRLDAIKEVQNRVIGRVPDRLMVSVDEPWQDVLVDSVVPISEVPPIEVEGHKRAVVKKREVISHDLDRPDGDEPVPEQPVRARRTIAHKKQSTGPGY